MMMTNGHWWFRNVGKMSTFLTQTDSTQHFYDKCQHITNIFEPLMTICHRHRPTP